MAIKRQMSSVNGEGMSERLRPNIGTGGENEPLPSLLNIQTVRRQVRQCSSATSANDSMVKRSVSLEKRGSEKHPDIDGVSST